VWQKDLDRNRFVRRLLDEAFEQNLRDVASPYSSFEDLDIRCAG